MQFASRIKAYCRQRHSSKLISIANTVKKGWNYKGLAPISYSNLALNS